MFKTKRKKGPAKKSEKRPRKKETSAGVELTDEQAEKVAAGYDIPTTVEAPTGSGGVVWTIGSPPPPTGTFFRRRR